MGWIQNLCSAGGVGFEPEADILTACSRKVLRPPSRRCPNSPAVSRRFGSGFIQPAGYAGYGYGGQGMHRKQYRH